MTPERWTKIDQLFHAALAQEPGRRAAFIAQASGGDAALRHEVESLISAHEQSGSFIETPASDVAAELLAAGQAGLVAGQSVGHYRVVSLLAAGGMGEVYLAEDTRLKRKVALKLLPPQFTIDATRVRRFTQEARAASALNHPNILTIYEIGQTNSAHFIATEFIEGLTLREYVRQRRMRLSEVLDVATQVVSALAAAHEAGVVHRDIKPENIMLRRDGIVKVLDFGLAKLAAQPSSPVNTEAATRTRASTNPGAIMGTVAYMSPEQASGREVDARTDLWSLGVVLYEMLTGRLPFEGKSPSHTIVLVLDEEPTPLVHYLPDAPESLQEIVADALAKDADARFQTAKQMLSKLRRLKRRLDAGAHPDHSLAPELLSRGGADSVSASDRTGERLAQPSTAAAQQLTTRAATAAQTAPTVSSAEYVTGQIKSHKKVAAVAALVALAALGGLAFGLYRLFGQRGVATKPPVAPLQNMKLTRLPAVSGQTGLASISPDGKFLVRQVAEGGKDALRLRQVEGTTEKEIVPTAEGEFNDLTFSRDGGSIYYVFVKKGEGVGHLYRVSVLGGDPQRLASDVKRSVTFSPDGRRLAFIREKPDEGSIVVTDADGGGEETPLTRAAPSLLRDVDWSPDGRVLAYAITGKDRDGFFRHLEAINVADRTTSAISTARWNFIADIRWLSDGSGLIMSARERSDEPMQLWHVSYPGGEPYKITNDLNAYGYVSLTADSRTALVTQSRFVAQVWVAPGGDSARARQITPGGPGGVNGTATSGVSSGLNGISWTPDGRLIYDSDASGNLEIWAANADGSGGKQLTFSPHTEGAATASPDGRFVVFLTNRSDGWSIWRMNADGSGAKALVRNLGHHPSRPRFSLDSRWVLYRFRDEAGKTVVWKVSVEGGEPLKLLEREVSSPSLSPDGRQLAVFYRDPGPKSPSRILIFPAEGGEPVRSLDPPPDANEPLFGAPDQPLGWAPDGRALDFVLTRDGASNIWRLSLDGGKPRQLTHWKSDWILQFAWAPDGRQLAATRVTGTFDLVLIQNFR